MGKSRIFYVVTLRSNVKKKDLKKFMEKEWLPAIRGVPGCLAVELLETYQDRAGHCVSELWESQEIHLKRTDEFWGGEGKALMKKMLSYAALENMWNCTVLDV